MKKNVLRNLFFGFALCSIFIQAGAQVDISNYNITKIKRKGLIISDAVTNIKINNTMMSSVLSYPELLNYIEARKMYVSAIPLYCIGGLVIATEIEILAVLRPAKFNALYAPLIVGVACLIPAITLNVIAVKKFNKVLLEHNGRFLSEKPAVNIEFRLAASGAGLKFNF